MAGRLEYCYLMQWSVCLHNVYKNRHIKMALNLFDERGSELADRLKLKPPNSLSLSSETRLMAYVRWDR